MAQVQSALLEKGFDSKIKLIERTEEITKLFLDFSSISCIPHEIGQLLGDPVKFRDLKVLQFFLQNSEISRILYKNPADFEMLERVYFGSSIRTGKGNGVDEWLSGSLPGQALRDRLKTVTDWLSEKLPVFLDQNGRHFKLVDFGSGPGPYAFETIKKMGRSDLHWDCVDIDRLALAIGSIRAEKFDLQEKVTFRSANFMRVFPEQKGNFGLMIGILCGMTKSDAINCLSVLREHLEKDSEFLVATLLTKSFEEAPEVFRVLCNVIGWQLRPKTISEVEEIYSLANAKVINIFSERDGGDGEYAIVHAKI